MLLETTWDEISAALNSSSKQVIPALLCEKPGTRGFAKCGKHWVIPGRQYWALGCFLQVLTKPSYSSPGFVVTLPLICWGSLTMKDPTCWTRQGKWGVGKRGNKKWLKGAYLIKWCLQWLEEVHTNPLLSTDWTQLRVNVFHIPSATAILKKPGCFAGFACVGKTIAIFQSLLLENCSNYDIANYSSCSPLPQRYHQKVVAYTKITLMISKGVEEGCQLVNPQGTKI